MNGQCCKRMTLMFVAVWSLPGCFAPKPTTAELKQAEAFPFAAPEHAAGDYDNAAEGRPTVSLWSILNGTLDALDTSAEAASVKFVTLRLDNRRLTATGHADGRPIELTRPPLAFEGGYFRRHESGDEPGTSCVPPSYIKHALLVGRRNTDGALVVVSKEQAWLRILFPTLSDGPEDAWINVFPRRQPPPQAR